MFFRAAAIVQENHGRDDRLKIEEASTPGQAARTTLVSESNVVAAPPRIYPARRRSDLGAAMELVCKTKRYARHLRRH
jgi:hypothetical protein